MRVIANLNSTYKLKSHLYDTNMNLSAGFLVFVLFLKPFCHILLLMIIVSKRKVFLLIKSEQFCLSEQVAHFSAHLSEHSSEQYCSLL